jgi:MFS family permease
MSPAVLSRVVGTSLCLSFFESFGTILLERGLYFFTHEKLGFTESENLALAFSFGVAYVLGALSSHQLCRRFGERFVLVASLVALLAAHLVLVWRADALLVVVTFPIVAYLQGLKWPILESFVSAGQPPRQMFRVVGYFNVSWALSVPLALAASGPLIALDFPPALFGLAAAINVVALLLCMLLPRKPHHLDEAHPERPNPELLERMQLLLTSSRWSMLAAYSLLFLLAPLVPLVLHHLGLSLKEATLAASWLDVVRVVAFFVLGFSSFWQGRPGLLAWVVPSLPLGFCLVLLAPNLPTLLLGETLFGVASAFTYYSALLYALVGRNAAVEAGGAHEGLIGLGFALGPLLGLLASWVGPVGVRSELRVVLTALPFMLLAALLAARPLLALRASEQGA